MNGAEIIKLQQTKIYEHSSEIQNMGLNHIVKPRETIKLKQTQTRNIITKEMHID